MSEGPKLYANKPKKAQLKQHQSPPQGSPLPSPSTPPSSSSMGSQSSSKPPIPPPQPRNESFARRYKFIWPVLLAVNFAIGGYLFMRTKKNDTGTTEGGEVAEVPSAPGAITVAPTTPVIEKPSSPPPLVEQVKLRDPLPENQQRELFKWLLEEKRKVKPKDPEEKKRIDEDKAILKQFIQAKSIPTL